MAGTGLSRGAFVAIIASTAVLFIGLVIVAVVVAATVVRSSIPSPVHVSEPTASADVFEALRLSDSDLAGLQLDASEGGRTPSQLSTAVAALQTNWTNSRGEPDPCLFTGGDPGTAVAPVWGDETAADPLWTESTVSASQSVSSDGVPFITVASRQFADEDAALDFLLQHNDRVPACTEYVSAIFQDQVTTTVGPLLVESAGVSNTGWVAETADWVEPGYGPETAIDLQFWVLNLQRGPIVTRVTMLVSAELEQPAGSLFTDLAGVIGTKMTQAIP